MTARIRRHPVAAALLAAVLVLGAVWAVKLGQVALGARSNADYWSQPQGETGGLLYVALGDSAAQAVGASDPQHGYVSLLADRLRDSTGKPVEVVNLSKSGARIKDVLDTQLPALAALGRTPDVITVAIGGNDVRAYDRATFAREADRLASALPDGTYVADAPYFMHGRWERDADQAAALLRQAAAEEGLRPVGLHAALKAQGWKAMLTQFAADWFHPNDRGHRVWADAFWHAMADDAARL
ncbi:MAG: SGNH/GDSL hydrolase family protein [Mycobacteriales bacterium]|nr:SGNH/GDSL hydrolase family protein [Mycobacteriales bacterium]